MGSRLPTGYRSIEGRFQVGISEEFPRLHGLKKPSIRRLNRRIIRRPDLFHSA
jgi:hypothetical protein